MPGSLLGLGARVRRHESTHSDRSDGSSDSRGSAKKVSFNKAVRVKKYPHRKGAAADPTSNGDRSPSPEKRFWFKVYKNLHRADHQDSHNDSGFVNSSRDDYDTDDDDSGHFGTLTTISETADTGTQTPNFKSSSSSSLHFQTEFAPLHPSQMPPEPPRVRKDHVKKIVDKFNEEAVLRVHRDDVDDYDDSPQPAAPSGGMRRSTSPDECCRDSPPAEVNAAAPSKSRKNPIINGVKVIFGMSNLKKRQGTVDTKNVDNLRKSRGTSMRDDALPNGSVPHHCGPYATHIVLPSKKDGEVQTTRSRKSKQTNGLVRTASDDVLRIGAPPPPHAFTEKWTSGDQLVLDTNDFHTESEKTDEGQFYKTVGEKHQVWRNETRTVVYEEPTSSTRRKAKSYNDLTEQDRSYDDHRATDDYRNDDRGVSTEQLYFRTAEAPSYVNQRDSSHRRHRNGTRGTSTEQLYFREADGPSYVNQRDVIDEVDHKYERHRQQRGTSTEQLHHSTHHERRSDYPSYVNQQETNGGNSGDTWRKKKHTRDQGVQCGKGVRDPDGEKYRVARSKEGDVSHADSWTGREDSSTLSKNGVIYSQVDKTKKKAKKEKSKNRKEEVRLEGNSAAPSYVNTTELGREEKADRKVKSSKSIFGFKLKTHREEPQTLPDADDRDRNWYDVETDLEAAERSRRSKDVILEDGASDVSAEASDLYRRNEASTPGSVIREVDYKKREISYENVPRPDVDREGGVVAGGGLWYRDADEDYRREMAQSEVSYPAGNQVGNDRYYTIGRVERSPRDASPSSPPRAYTLDRRHLEEKRRSNNNVVNTSGVKILVNGEEVDDVVDTPKKHSSKAKGHRKNKQRDLDDNNLSSVQSDPLYERGGLAAAYQARQRAAVKRSSSSATPGMLNGYRVRQQHGLSSSAASGISSSDSDSTRRRRTLVMYIPGVSHQRKQADEGDRVSGASVARSQSMMSASRPTKYVKHGGVRRTRFTEDESVPLASSSETKRKGASDGKKQSDIRRRHSMPKDTKFSWLKWKIKGKPSREP